MAPRNKRSQGLTRMDAALDAMRPMGFKDSAVRKCVKDLLKVYGNDGWLFIEEAAYKVLIDTILELPEEPPRLEHVPKPLLEGNVDGTRELLVSGPEPCKEVVIGGEEARPLRSSRLRSSRFQKLMEEIDEFEEDEEAEEQGQKLDAVVAPKLLEDASNAATQSQDGGFSSACTPQVREISSACTPQVRDIVPKTRKPSFGWISDDDEDDDDGDAGGGLQRPNSAN